MKEIRWIGRGGQGAFTASKILGAAALRSGKYAMAFPSFGPERRGAPLQAFTKIADDKISDRSEIIKADYIVVLDETLYTGDLVDDLKDGGRIILNTSRDLNEESITTIDGLGLALEILGRPITNTAMVGALVGVSDLVELDYVTGSLEDHLPKKIVSKNKALVDEAYRRIQNAKS